MYAAMDIPKAGVFAIRKEQTTMKKFFALIMAVAMMLSCTALADELLAYNYESNVEDWAGKWTLVGAYIGEDFAEEYEVGTSGMIAVKENAIEIEITLDLDGSANDPAGVLVDTANYYHAHVYDLEGTLTFADYADETYTIKSAWDQWPNTTVRGENDGDFNMGPAKTKIKGDDETLHWAEITGVEIEDQDDMKYIGTTADGQLFICYADKNVAKKDEAIGFAYIFNKVAE